MSRFTTEHPMSSKPVPLSPRGQRIFRWALIPAGIFAIYVGCFVWRFDIFSAPVRDNEHGWLGPRIRGDSHSVDIGEVYYYEGTDFSLYDRYSPLCALWLTLQGL